MTRDWIMTMSMVKLMTIKMTICHLSLSSLSMLIMMTRLMMIMMMMMMRAIMTICRPSDNDDNVPSSMGVQVEGERLVSTLLINNAVEVLMILVMLMALIIINNIMLIMRVFTVLDAGGLHWWLGGWGGYHTKNSRPPHSIGLMT